MAPRKRSADAGEPDAIVPAPEQNLDLIGHERAEAELLGSLKSGRLHHAWLITGPKGVGKATLAFRFARFLLRHGRDTAAIKAASTLDVAPGDPILRQVASGAAQDLLVIRRPQDAKTGVEKAEIPVSEVRRLQPFFGLAAGAGGYRIAIVDTVDELNRFSANALLKTLEEPPEHTVLLLIAHAPGRALATIRSRCRTLALSPLEPPALAEKLSALGERLGLPGLAAADRLRLALLAGGRVGRALELWSQGGLALSLIVDETLQAFPDLSAGTTAALLDQVRDNFATSCDLLIATLRDAARRGALGEAPAEEHESAAIKRLARGASPKVWAELAADLEALFARGEAIYLDERAMMGEALRRIAGAAQRA